jgi:hypothetical protein
MEEKMVDLLSTPALVITILGAVGLAIPVIDALKSVRVQIINYTAVSHLVP